VWSLSAPYLIILSELEKKNTNLKGGGMKTEKLKRVNIMGVFILFFCTAPQNSFLRQICIIIILIILFSQVGIIFNNYSSIWNKKNTPKNIII